MNERSDTISKLKNSAKFRASYLRAKLNINIPSQIRALRRRQDLTQAALAEEAGMKQSRISAMERPGETKFNLETLIRVAAAFKVGLIVRFVPFSDVLRWENGFSQDAFDVTKIDEDAEFLNPGTAFAAIGQSAYRGLLSNLPGKMLGENQRGINLRDLMPAAISEPKKAVPSSPKPALSVTDIHFVPQPGVGGSASMNPTASAEKQVFQELRA